MQASGATTTLFPNCPASCVEAWQLHTLNTNMEPLPATIDALCGVQLHTICFQAGVGAVGALNDLLRRAPLLQSVTISRCNGDTLYALGANCPRLQSFSAVGGDDAGDESVNDASVQGLVRGCPRVTFFTFDNMRFVGDVGWISIAQGMRGLLHLSANSALLMTDRAVVEMARHLRRLRSLDVQYCPLLTDVSMRALHYYLRGTLIELRAGGTQMDDNLARRWTQEGNISAKADFYD